MDKRPSYGAAVRRRLLLVVFRDTQIGGGVVVSMIGVAVVKWVVWTRQARARRSVRNPKLSNAAGNGALK